MSRQGNLVVEASRSVTNRDLHRELLAEVKRQGKPYGMVFTDISGGFTNTGRLGPQAFKVNPVMAYRVYPDGRKELVRGVDIVGTPLSALGNIVKAGRPVETFNGMCGAESGLGAGLGIGTQPAHRPDGDRTRVQADRPGPASALSHRR